MAPHAESPSPGRPGSRAVFWSSPQPARPGQRQQCYLRWLEAVFDGCSLMTFSVFSCCEWKYLFFLFSFALEPKFLFLVVGNCLPAAGLEGKLWYGALLDASLKMSSIISSLVWQVQKPGAGPTSARRSVYLIVDVCPCLLLRRVVAHPGRYLLSVLMSGSLG